MPMFSLASTSFSILKSEKQEGVILRASGHQWQKEKLVLAMGCSKWESHTTLGSTEWGTRNGENPDCFLNFSGREDGDVVHWTDNTGVVGKSEEQKMTYLEIEGIVFVLETSRREHASLDVQTPWKKSGLGIKM